MKLSRLALVLVVGSGSSAACESAGRDAPTTTAAPGTAGETGSDTAAPTTTGDDAAVGSEGSAGVTTGPPVPEVPCAQDNECILHGDCCSCIALHRDQPAPEDCPGDCERDACDVWGLTEVLCSHECRVALVECDPAMVTCADAPPDCEDGQLPSLLERCWSGHCVPQDLCRPF